jgi:CubicO group peptidase (beta-lactamase class C family)
MTAFVLPYVPSEHLGFVPDRLDRLTAAMEREIDDGKTPGMSLLVVRHGKVAYRQTLGKLAPDGPPMREDAIFRMYSMTKPVVSVAAMMLVEKGRLALPDPVSKYIPAFGEAKVGVETVDGLMLLPLTRPITVHDLMRHTSGLVYGFNGPTEVHKRWLAANLFDLGKTTEEQADAIAALPLLGQPGETWNYGHSTDVLGRVVEVVEGARLSDVLRERIFAPLDMQDTAFFTPAAKLARRAEPFNFGGLENFAPDTIDVVTPPHFEMGGTGLVSTLADYARFLAMLTNGGIFQGERILGPRTIAFMASDHLEPGCVKQDPLLWPGHGYGLGFAVRTDAGRAPTAGSVGEYFWGGTAATYFWISPADQLFAVMLAQAPQHRDYFRWLFRDLVTAALL